MTQHDKPDGDFRDGMPFLGGSIWIDLLNSTLSPDGGATIVDFLEDDRAFARWCANAGFVAKGIVASERRTAEALRDLLRPVFDQLAAGKPAPAALIARINALLADAPFIRQLGRGEDQLGYRLREQPADAPHRVVSRIAEDFAQFAADHEANRLKHCDNPACTMLFYDKGKNNRRRWCSAAVCGNRDKVANYRARKSRRDRL